MFSFNSMFAIPRIRIDIEARKVAARNVQADAVTAPEDHLDGELLRLAGHEHLGLL
jgi:hypothetical protein